jgi:hypothetical protein
MVRYGNAMRVWFVRFENDVTAFLMHAAVTVLFAEDLLLTLLR